MLLQKHAEDMQRTCNGTASQFQILCLSNRYAYFCYLNKKPSFQMHVQFPVKSRRAEHVLKEDLSFSFLWASDQPTWRMNSIFFRKSSISKYFKQNNEKWISRHDWKQEIWEKGKNDNRKKKLLQLYGGMENEERC